MENATQPRFTFIKKAIAAQYTPFEEHITKSWTDILAELSHITQDIATQGSQSWAKKYIPEVNFSDIPTLDTAKVAEIRTKGCVVIRNLFDRDLAEQWKATLEDIIKTNPDIQGLPPNDRQFYELYWTKPQIEARSHPNMLAVSKWLNNFYHSKSGCSIEGVDLSSPLTYSDRLRIRRPGKIITALPPHIDGATLERWEEPNTREIFKDIFAGEWRSHDPYALEGRLEALTSLYNRPNQVGHRSGTVASPILFPPRCMSILSETGPNEGTIKVLPSVQVVNAYIILRPFFKPLVPINSPEIWDRKNWVFDVESPEFPGIVELAGGYYQGPSPKNHPHLRLDETMTAMPKVYPGDAVFWHCDVVHCVETEHKGKGDSAVLFIPAVPKTPRNEAYIKDQYQRFTQGLRPADFPQGPSEQMFSGIARREDITNPAGRRAMGML